MTKRIPLSAALAFIRECMSQEIQPPAPPLQPACTAQSNAEAFGCVKNTIRLLEGGYFDFNDPQPQTFTLVDIANALSKICRFGGQVGSFYSVAEHSVRCAEQARQDGRSVEAQVAVLMHDSAEAFVGDVVKPLKIMLPEYTAIEQRVEDAIAKKFGIDFNAHKASIREIDHAMLINERRHLFSADNVTWFGENEVRELDCKPYRWTPEQARREFLIMAETLGMRPIQPPTTTGCPECGGSGRIESDSSLNTRSKPCPSCRSRAAQSQPAESPTGDARTQIHELKTWPEYFSAVLDGRKRFELRTNDRPFKVGDTLRLREWDRVSHEYTGRQIDARVTYLTNNKNWLNGHTVAMSIEPVEPTANARIAEFEASLSAERELKEAAERYNAAVTQGDAGRGGDLNAKELPDGTGLWQRDEGKWQILVETREENAKLREQLASAKAIIAKHDLCHDLHGKVGVHEFAEGCRREMIKEFGECPWDTLREQLTAAKARADAAEAELAKMTAKSEE